MVLPPLKRDDADPEADCRSLQARPGLNFNTSFLVYYQVSPILNRALIVGMLPLKIDDENSDFWMTYQEQPSSVFLQSPNQRYQFKKQELENLEFCNKMAKGATNFVDHRMSHFGDPIHPDYQFIMQKAVMTSFK